MAATQTPRFRKFRNLTNFGIFGMPVGGNDRAPIRRPGLSDALCGGHLHGLVFQTTAPHREDVFRRPPAKAAPPDPRPKIRSCRKPVPSQTISLHTCNVDESRCRESLNITTTCTTAGREQPAKFAARRVTLPRPNNFTVTKQPAITGAQQRTKHPRPSRRRPSPPSGARSKGNLESLAAEPLARLPPLACELAPARTQLHKRL